MKKSVLFAAAIAGVLCSCSQDDIASGGAPGGVSDLVPIQIGVSSQSNVTTRGTGTVGGFEGDNEWAGQGIKVYMFNKGTVTPATEGDGSVTPIYANFDFVAPTGGDSASASAVDGSIKYYPTTGEFDFVGYRIDDATGSPSEPVLGEAEDGLDSLTIGVEIDGTQDIMSAIATPTSAEILELGTYPDRYFSAYSARRNVHPDLEFKHLLTRLNFQVIGGNQAACYDGLETPGEETCVRVTSIKIYSKTTGELVIAKRVLDENNDTIVATGALRFTDEKDSLTLMQREDPSNANENLVAMDEVLPTWNNEESKADVVQAGEAMLVAPDSNYVIKITLKQRVPENTSEEGTVADYADKTYVMEDVVDLADGMFLAGHSYNVNIYVYGLQKIDINASLTPWEEGGDINLDPSDGVMNQPGGGMEEP